MVYQIQDAVLFHGSGAGVTDPGITLDEFEEDEIDEPTRFNRELHKRLMLQTITILQNH